MTILLAGADARARQEFVSTIFLGGQRPLEKVIAEVLDEEVF